MEAMEAANILRQCSLPCDRHRQEQRVKPSVIKTLTNIATCSEDQALIESATFNAVVAILRFFADMPPRRTTIFLTNGENLL